MTFDGLESAPLCPIGQHSHSMCPVSHPQVQSTVTMFMSNTLNQITKHYPLEWWSWSAVRLASHQTHYRFGKLGRWDSGTSYYGTNDPSNSVKELKEDRSLETGFYPIRSPHCVSSHMQHEKNTKYTNTNESKHSEMGPVWQNPIQRTVRTTRLKCAYDCAQLQYTIQHRTVAIISLLTSSSVQWFLEWPKWWTSLQGPL